MFPRFSYLDYLQYFFVMNKITLIIAFVGYVSSARLDNLQYLPPQGNSIQGPSQQPGYDGAQSSQQGGQYHPSGPSLGPHGQGPSSGLQGPQGPSGSQQQYPQGHTSQPTSQYGAPTGPAGQGAQQYPEQQYPEQRSPLADVPILRLDTENPGDGTYRYAYETGNDIVAQEEGNAQSGWNRAQGSYRFVSPEGQNFEITYTADENGYNPQGAHLPTPPPIPDAILKSLEIIRQAEAAGNIIEGAYQPEGDDGQYHESHDEGQYNHQQPSGGYQQSSGGYQQPSGGFQQPSGGYQQGGVDISKSGGQDRHPAPQGFSHQNEGQQRYPGQQGGYQQPAAPNGGYRY